MQCLLIWSYFSYLRWYVAARAADPGHFNADPHTSFHFNAGPYPHPTFHLKADPYPIPHYSVAIWLVYRPSTAPFKIPNLTKMIPIRPDPDPQHCNIPPQTIFFGFFSDNFYNRRNGRPNLNWVRCITEGDGALTSAPILIILDLDMSQDNRCQLLERFSS
jgi:hypothetical protein